LIEHLGTFDYSQLVCAVQDNLRFVPIKNDFPTDFYRFSFKCVEVGKLIRFVGENHGGKSLLGKRSAEIEPNQFVGAINLNDLPDDNCLRVNMILSFVSRDLLERIGFSFLRE